MLLTRFTVVIEVKLAQHCVCMAGKSRKEFSIKNKKQNINITYQRKN
jgi:hypothetical protein